MIRMKDWKVFCPESDRILGHVGDNLLRRLEIETDTGPEWSVVLDFEKGSGKNVAAMSQTDNILWVDLTDEMLGKNGTYTAQLRGMCGEKVAHSNLFTLIINRSINAIDSFPPLKPSEIAQLEAEMNRLKAEAALSADGAKASETAVNELVSEAEQHKTDAQTAAERSEAARDAIILDEQRLSQAVRDAAGSANSALSDANRSKEEADRSETEANEAEKWANKAQGYAEQATVPAVAGVYNIVLTDRITAKRYAMIVENGTLVLLEVSAALEAAEPVRIDTVTGTAYYITVEDGVIVLAPVEEG